MSEEVTYSSYLKVDELLGLQQPLSDPVEHDEMLFIVIHQVYELWFKQMLWETDQAVADLRRGDLYASLARFKRLRTIMKTCVSQLDILETMTPMSFLSFRDRLSTASGFQSAQFRAFEFAYGYKRPEMLRHYPEGAQRDELERRLAEPSVVDAFHAFLEARGYRLPEEVKGRDVRQPTEPSGAMQDLLVRVYRERPDLVQLMETLLDFDEGVQEWRYRHVKMVERTIGHKQGTGGSSGAAYLRGTLFRSFIPDLWVIRDRL